MAIGDADHRPGSGQELDRIKSPIQMLGKVTHFAVSAGGDPAADVIFMFGCPSRGHADQGIAQLPDTATNNRPRRHIVM